MKVRCPNCGAKYNVPANGLYNCDACGQNFMVDNYVADSDEIGLRHPNAGSAVDKYGPGVAKMPKINNGNGAESDSGQPVKPSVDIKGIVSIFFLALALLGIGVVFYLKSKKDTERNRQVEIAKIEAIKEKTLADEKRIQDDKAAAEARRLKREQEESERKRKQALEEEERKRKKEAEAAERQRLAEERAAAEAQRKEVNANKDMYREILRVLQSAELDWYSNMPKYDRPELAENLIDYFMVIPSGNLTVMTVSANKSELSGKIYTKEGEVRPITREEFLELIKGTFYFVRKQSSTGKVFVSGISKKKIGQKMVAGRDVSERVRFADLLLPDDFLGVCKEYFMRLPESRCRVELKTAQGAKIVINKPNPIDQEVSFCLYQEVQRFLESSPKPARSALSKKPKVVIRDDIKQIVTRMDGTIEIPPTNPYPYRPTTRRTGTNVNSSYERYEQLRRQAWASDSSESSSTRYVSPSDVQRCIETSMIYLELVD